MVNALATLPTAFLAGVLGRPAYHSIEYWAYSRQVRLSQPSELVMYGVFVVVPFIFCVLGWDSKRWDDGYWFTDGGKADMRRMWIRWGAYFIGGLISYAIV